MTSDLPAAAQCSTCGEEAGHPAHAKGTFVWFEPLTGARRVNGHAYVPAAVLSERVEAAWDAYDSAIFDAGADWGVTDDQREWATRAIPTLRAEVERAIREDADRRIARLEAENADLRFDLNEALAAAESSAPASDAVPIDEDVAVRYEEALDTTDPSIGAPASTAYLAGKLKCPRCGEMALLRILPAPSTEEVCGECYPINAPASAPHEER